MFYNKKTGQISGEFDSRVNTLTTSSIQYDDSAKGTFTGQMVKDGKSMTTFLKGTANYYILYHSPGHVRQDPYNDKGELPWTAAAVVSQQTY